MIVTINILGHLQVFQQGMVALQMIFDPTTGSSDWSSAGNFMSVGPVALLALTFALLHISTKGIWMQKVQLHHVGMMLGMYAVLFVPTVNVDIHDVTTGQDAIVDNIPIGVAYPAAAISALSLDAANQLGTAFQSTGANNPPLDLQSGVASPLKQMLGLEHFYYQVATQSPALTLGLAHFVQQCVYPLSTTNAAAGWGALSQDPNLLEGGAGTLFSLPIPASDGGIITMETLALGGGNADPCAGSPAGAQCTESCAQGQQDLQAAYTAWYNNSGQGTCAQAITTNTTHGDQPQITNCGASANGSLGPVVGSAGSGGSYSQNLANTATFGSEFIQQIYAACIANAGWQMGMNGTTGQNSAVAMPAYCQIQGTAQNTYNAVNAASANMFISNMLPMMSILQFLFFALAPLAAAVMMFAGGQGVGIFTKYLMFGLWTQSWFPVAAVLNDYGQMTVSEKLANYGVSLTGGGGVTPSASALSTIANLPDVLLHLQNTLGNVDMMLALTPVITMIVFTGSYMAMSGMAQDIYGGDNTAKETGGMAPGLKSQETMAGVHATGNPLHAGMYSGSAAMDGIGINTGSVLNASVGARVASAAQQSQAANSELALSSMDAWASKIAHSDGASGSQKTEVAGTQGSRVSGQHSQGVKTMESTDQSTQFLAKAGYALALDHVLKSQGASKMTPDQIKAAAEKEAASMLQDPASMASAFAAAGKGALANIARGFKTGLDAQAASKVAQQAQHDVGDTLTSTSEGGVMKKLSGALGIDSKDQKALEQNKQVQDSLKKAKSANQQYQHAEELSTQVSAATSGGASQSLTGNQLLSVMEDAGNGSAYRGGQALLAGTSDATRSLYESKYNSAVARGSSSQQAAVTAYASTVNSTEADPNGDGVKAMQALFSQPTTIGMNPALSKVTPLLGSVANDVDQMKAKTALTPKEKEEDGQLGNQSKTLPGQVDAGTAGASKIKPSTPGAVGAGGMTRAETFGAGAEGATTQAFTPKTGEVAYHQAVNQNSATKRAAANTNSALAKFANLESKNPNGALAGLIVANGAGGFLGDLKQALENRALVGKARESFGKGNGGGADAEGGSPRGTTSPSDPPEGSPGGGAAPDGKPTSAETPRPLTPEEVSQSKAAMQARVNAGDPKSPVASPTTTAEGATERRAAARDAARAAMGEPIATPLGDAAGAAARRESTVKATQFASEAAAREAMEKVMANAGARLVENAPVATAVADAAASTGTPVGALVGMAVEGGVVVMNADVAATVLQTGTEMVAQFGPTKAAEILGDVLKTGANTAISNAGAGAKTALDNVGSNLGMPNPTP